MDKFNLQDYILDFERIRELSDNGIIAKDKSESDMFPKIEYSTVNAEVIKKYLTIFGNCFRNEDGNNTVLVRTDSNSRRDNNYTFFIIETLIYNKILIHKRHNKLEKLLKEKE
jgi:hypothetical protein